MEGGEALMRVRGEGPRIEEDGRGKGMEEGRRWEERKGGWWGLCVRACRLGYGGGGLRGEEGGEWV